MANRELHTRMLSSLAKVFPDRIYGRVSKEIHAARGQCVSFQVAYRFFASRYRQKNYRIELSSPLSEHTALYCVGNVPSALAAYPERNDDNYISKRAGLYPDPLYPLEGDSVPAVMGFWRTLWVTVKIPKALAAGRYSVAIAFLGEDGAVAAKSVCFVTVHEAILPDAKLRYTQWFHCDCIADAHGVGIFSEEHWRLIGDYMRLAAEHGMNMILTPVLTPPLDTAVGSERPTVQLVDVDKQGDSYRFDFTRLERYVKLALACGIRDFEISHFFTQWGAGHAPKVMAREGGEVRRIFGWETAADDPAYVSFLGQLIPSLIRVLEGLGVTKERIWFHVSDEPHREHLPRYRVAKSILRDLIVGCHHIDALSDYDFYREGLVEVPVVATGYIEPYLNARVDNMWCYYCCSQCVKVSNRFFSMPSARNRIIGVQMYKYGMSGFLHWGYNFYYSEHSVRRIDPYAETDGGGAFPSGDAFSVYPYKDGVIPSLRQKVFANALEDIRLLQLLENKIGKARVVELLDALSGGELTFSSYPKDESFFAELYRRVFALLDD